jgi:hypothetical protein
MPSPSAEAPDALKKSLAEKRKPVAVATAAAAGTGEEEAAPKKRARKSGVG